MQQMSNFQTTEQNEFVGLSHNNGTTATLAPIAVLYPVRPSAADFVNCVRNTIKSNLGKCNLDIVRTAKSLHTSVRTLQRELSDEGLSYSMLMDQARLELASKLLLQSDMKIIDLAYDLGYEDPSHFARAFRRITGTSPREYRAATPI